MEPLAVSINEATKIIGLGRTSIYAMIADGRLKVFKVGRRTLVRVKSIRQLSDEQVAARAARQSSAGEA